MKKMTALLLCGAIAASVFTGCAGSSRQPAASADPSSGQPPAESGGTVPGAENTGRDIPTEPVTLKMMAANSAKDMSDLFKARNEQFSEMYPNVTIEMEELPFADFTKKMNLTFASGMAPDIIYAAISNIANGVEREQYECLDDYIAQWDDRDDIFPNLYDMGTYKGSIYSMPLNLAPQLLVYRKDYFAEAGLDPDTPPSSWEELLDAARKTMVEENGRLVRSGISIAVDGTFNPLIFVRTNGANLFDEDGNFTVNTPEFIEGAEYVKQLQATSMPVNSQLEDSQHPLTSGNAAMSLINVGKLTQWLEDVPEMADQIGFIIPQNKKSSIWVGASYLQMSTASRYKDLVWEYIEMHFSAENIQENSERFGQANVRISLQENYERNNPLIAQAIADAIEVGEGANKVVNFTLGSNQILAAAMQEVYYSDRSVEEILNDAKEQFEQLAAEDSNG